MKFNYKTKQIFEYGSWTRYHLVSNIWLVEPIIKTTVGMMYFDVEKGIFQRFDGNKWVRVA